MKKYKGLFAPEQDVYFEEIRRIQNSFCENSIECPENCCDCLFSCDNIDQFKQWYKKNFDNDEKQ